MTTAEIRLVIADLGPTGRVLGRVGDESWPLTPEGLASLDDRLRGGPPDGTEIRYWGPAFERGGALVHATPWLYWQADEDERWAIIRRHADRLLGEVAQ